MQQNKCVESKKLFDKASQIIPGGVNSPVRGFKAVGGTPRFIAKAQGPYLYDVDGNQYVDLICSWGPMILGHCHPDVIAAVTDAAARGTSFGAPCVTEVELVQEIVDRVEPVEQVRLVSSGTEATMSAIRLARGATGRELIIKFAGHYHGHADALLAQSGSGVATLALPGSAGVTQACAGETIVLPYNDFSAITAVFERYANRIAAVITEAAAGNMGVVAPAPGFTEHLRKITKTHGALLISDEVMTGFRVSRAGWFGIEGQTKSGAPDLFTFGKVMGGGFPAAAFGGSAEIMAHLAPLGAVYQAGTLSGNPVATAAGLATLKGCTPTVYAQLDKYADQICAQLVADLQELGVPHQINRAGSMFSVFFTDQPVVDFESAQHQNTALFAKFFHQMLDRGVYLPPSAFESWFVSAAHGPVIDKICSTIKPALKAALKAK